MHYRFYQVSFICLIVITFCSTCSPQQPAQLYTTPYTEKPVNTTPIPQQSNTADDTNTIITRETTIRPTPNLTTNIRSDIKIAFLAPMSGPSKELGKALFDAAQLALFDIGSPNLSILPFDTKGTAEGAREAIVKAVDAEVKMVLGPVFSSASKAITTIAHKHNIEVISFSNNRELTRHDIFLLGFMPEQQIARVVDYAHRRGIRDFSALVPKDAFGSVVIDALIGTLRSHAAGAKRIEFYEAIDARLSASINRIVGEPPEDFREDDNPFIRQEVEKTEVLLVPEGGRRAMNIAARVFRHGLEGAERFRLLGSGQWDDEELADEKKMIGSWFATSAPGPRRAFEKHFSKTYGYVPVRIASLGYDGVALAAFLASASREGDFSRSAITNSRGFSGVNGVFRLTDDGTAERALAIIEITEEGFQVVDPAPQDFNFF